MVVGSAIHFGFLNKETFILASPQSSGYLHIAQICGGRVKTRAILKLPDVQDGIKVDSISNHSSALPLRPKGVCPDQDKRIQTFAIIYDTEIEAQTTHCLFVHNDYLLRHLPSKPWQPGAKPMVLSWLEWGPQHSRFLHFPGIFHWMRCVNRFTEWLGY